MENNNLTQRTVRATVRVCQLPAIPTQDWGTDAARAMLPVGPGAVACALVAQFNQAAQTLKIISTGLAQDTQHDDPSARALYLQDKFERLTKLGFDLPSETGVRGLVAPLASLTAQWSTTPLGRALAAQNLAKPILVAVPVNPAQPGFYLLLVVAFEQPDDAPPQQETLEILRGLVPVLADRSRVALAGVTNPKAWLTEREHEILDQLIQGHSVRVIAEKLGRSAHTVHDHVKNLHKKLGASSRGELIAKALGHKEAAPDLSLPQMDPVVLGHSDQVAEIKPGASNTQRVHARPLHTR